jgi:hypothetical protein
VLVNTRQVLLASISAMHLRQHVIAGLQEALVLTR